MLFTNNSTNGVAMSLQKTISANEVYLRFYFKISALTLASGGYVYLASLLSASGTNGVLRIVPQSGINCLQLQYYDVSNLLQKTSSTPILTNTVYCLEFHFKRGAGNAELHVYLDGAELSDLTVTGVSINSTTNNVALGSTWASYPGSGNNFDIFYDCVVVSDSYVGPISQGSLTVAYFANNPIGTTVYGSVPVDNASYFSGATVTVLPNRGNLVVPGHIFLGWELYGESNPPTFAVVGSSVSPSSFVMGNANVSLFGVWAPVGGFDGGTINNSLEIKCQFPYLADQSAIGSWMTSAPLNPSNYGAYLRFTNINSPQHSTDMYGITFKDDANINVPAIGINDSLLVRKNLFAQGYIRTAKSILRLEKSTPYAPPNAGAAGNVNIGKANWPFDELFASYGHIGDLEVPQALKTDWIQSLTNVDLTITPRGGKKIKLDGDVQINGTLTGGGGGGVSWNGGAITNPFEIRRNFIEFNTGAAVRDWMYAETLPGVLHVPSPGIGIRFAKPSGTDEPFNDIFSATLPGGSVAIAINYHLLVRKDFNVRGKIDSREGILVLHGNGQNAVPPQGGQPGNDRWNIGWGPRAGGAPFIWLAEGGDRLTDFGIGGNPAAETLLIVTNNTNPQTVPPEVPVMS
jgi:hypothetical protein